MYFLEEWNNSAVAILLSVVLIAVTVIFLILSMIFSVIKPLNTYIQQAKQHNRIRYIAIRIFTFILAALILFAVGNLLNN